MTPKQECEQLIEGQICGRDEEVVHTELVGNICGICRRRLAERISND